MKRPKVIYHIYILYHNEVNFQFSHNLAGFPDILN